VKDLTMSGVLESLREWLAAKVFAETGRVEAVAARLGMASLDAAAHLVGYNWTREFDIDAPPPPHAGRKS